MKKIDQSTRRYLLRATMAASASVIWGRSSLAEFVCNNIQCDARIPTRKFIHISQPVGTYWCWAATIAMICTWHKRNISQESIVRQTFGVQANLPADPITMIQALNRSYISDDGIIFKITPQIWSALHGIADLNNSVIIQELKDNRPLVVCNLSHMMALVGVSFGMGSVSINQAWVADPAIDGVVTGGIPGLEQLAPGFRYLFPAELVPASAGGALLFMAAIQVT